MVQYHLHFMAFMACQCLIEQEHHRFNSPILFGPAVSSLVSLFERKKEDQEEEEEVEKTRISPLLIWLIHVIY